MKNYKVNKYLTNGAFLLLALYFLVATYGRGLDPLETKVYIYCPETEPQCVNPFYEENFYFEKIYCNDPLKCKQFLQAGESIGEPKKPDPFLDNFFVLIIAVLSLAFTFNHYKYNKKEEYDFVLKEK